MKSKLSLIVYVVGHWEIPVLGFDDATSVISFPVRGIIANSIPKSDTGKRRLARWKTDIAVAAKAARGTVVEEAEG